MILLFAGLINRCLVPPFIGLTLPTRRKFRNSMMTGLFMVRFERIETPEPSVYKPHSFNAAMRVF